MRFYHYTGTEHVEPIRELGIVANPAAFLGLGIDGVPAVWLTTSDDWALQRRTWGTMHALDCDRTERRFELELSIAETHLWRWDTLAPKLCAMAGGDLRDLVDFNREGHEEWWVYLRSIPRQRLGELDARPDANSPHVGG